MKIRIDPMDTKWSKFVRERDGACEYCGKSDGRLNAHHFIRRGIAVTRYDIENGISLCVHHHTFDANFSAHRTPESFDKWFKKHDPKRYKYLKERSKVIMPRLQARMEFKEMYNLK